MKFRHFFFFFGDESFDERGVAQGLKNEASDAWKLLRPVLFALAACATIGALSIGAAVMFFWR